MRRPAVLVVDDEPGMLRAVARILGHRHDVTTARGAADALAAARSSRHDLAIVDVRMPELSGFELTARLKQVQPDLDVILMTGSVNDPDRKLVRAIRESAFYFIQKPFDREVLETLVSRCLELRRLGEDNRRHLRRVEGELEEARAFQRGMLPAGSARLAGCTIDCRYVPSAELGGDFYDYAAGSDGQLSLLVADVSGHGAAAAMLTGIVKSAFHSARGDGPAAVIERIAAGWQSFAAERFVTVFCARLDPSQGIGSYASAGHPPAVLLDAGGWHRDLGSTGLLVSPVFPAARWREEALALTPGARLLVYTDGVTEAASADDSFGHQRLIEELKGAVSGDGAALDGMLAALDVFTAGRPPQDDRTLVLVRLAADRAG